MSNKVNNFKKTHAINSWINLILSIFIVICVFMAVVHNLLAMPDELVQERGIKTFRMFTVLSNMLVATSFAMTIPFAVDGIRQKNYHLPRWIVNFTFVSVSCVTLTFLISVTILSPNAGYKEIMASGTNLFLHTLVPVSSIIALIFVNSYHTIKFRATFYTLFPIFLYSTVYVISAIFIGEDNGGWRDHYHFQKLMPWYFAYAMILALGFIIANILRLAHNSMHRRDKKKTENYYQNAPEYNLPTIEEAIKQLAQENKKNDKGGEVIVPRRIIKFLNNKYNSEKSLNELCNIYINEYLA